MLMMAVLMCALMLCSCKLAADEPAAPAEPTAEPAALIIKPKPVDHLSLLLTAYLFIARIPFFFYLMAIFPVLCRYIPMKKAVNFPHRKNNYYKNVKSDFYLFL